MRTVIKGEYLDYIVRAVTSAGIGECVIELNSDHWLIRAKGPSDVLMTAIYIPENQMGHYEQAGYERIGINLDKVDNFVRNDDDDIEMWVEERTLHMQDSTSHVALATIDPDSVTGKTENVLKVDYEVVFKHDPQLLIDFIKRGKELTGEDSFMMGARDEGIYLYMVGDNARFDDFISKDDFSHFETDWSINNSPDFGGLSPAEDKGVDVLMSADFAEHLDMLSDDAVISFGNHIPMKILFEELGDEGGKPVKISYFQTPRLDKTGDMKTLPDRVLNK